jgi:hypothetical protein
MMGSIGDIFMTMFEIVKYLMSSFRKKAEYFEKYELYTKFKTKDLDDYLSIYSMFWSKF